MLNISEDKAKKYSNIITTASITLLLLFYVFPLTTVEVGPSSPYFLVFAYTSPEMLVRARDDPDNATFKFYNNYNMMQNSFDEEVVELSKSVTIIIALIWINIIFGLISHVGILLNIMQKRLSSKILCISCFSSITSITLLVLIIDFMQKNQLNPHFENSSLILTEFPIKYIYFIILVALTALSASIMYTKFIISSKIKDKKSLRENNYKEKTIDKKDKIIISTGKKSSNELKTSEGKDLKFRLSTPINTDENKKLKDEDVSKEETDKKEYQVPFNYRKENESEINQGNNPIEKKEAYNKKLNVKCPQCGSIFEAEKQPDSLTRIKCPQCGKDGIIR